MTERPCINPVTGKAKSQRPYIPRYRSGAFALLVALDLAAREPTYKGYLLKTELQKLAVPYTDAPMESVRAYFQVVVFPP